MTGTVPSLTTFYSGWAAYQRSLATIIGPLSPAQLALRTAPHHWSIGMVAQHIVADRVWWFHGWMGEGNPDLMAFAHWDPAYDDQQPLREAAELVAGLAATWRMVAGALARWTPADLERRFPPAAFLDEEERRTTSERTRQWIIWHVLEHEIFHGGELSLALGAIGLPGIYGAL